MRQWMCDPRIMCRQHLLGEHVEHHMFVGTINKGIDVTGYLTDNLLQPSSLISRHEELVAEMERRGYKHKSPLPFIEFARLSPARRDVEIDRPASLTELLRRCPECRARYDALVASGELKA